MCKRKTTLSPIPTTFLINLHLLPYVIICPSESDWYKFRSYITSGPVLSASAAPYRAYPV
ncbi:hypothetical protein RIR_e9321_A0A2N1NJB3_9GLOM [Rhizophagus irregularis DAOM 181602=DAOM 197198]|uniref:Uncharacterized protein n=1 Tax=Rhizophagus irregularis TaxID=588596 RepID=A0A2N1NJB3_9GLOM|nr:hypothetical protein RhiirC2_313576 [Rhizophagus irregularis]GBC23719.2 hypothetical protein RIR_e9321_A0A2N1NJB3_9GLOM [Rhizophagus irregularis DAOM 181602=DAOM 197198]